MSQGTKKWYTSLMALLILSGMFMVLEKSDAATYKLYPIDDASVNKHSPDSIYGALNYLNVEGNGDSAHGYLKFNLDSLESNEWIISATFSITGWWIGLGSGSVDLYHIADDSWTEETLTWKNQPNNLNDPIGSRGLSDPYTWLTWDLLENRTWDTLFDQNGGILSLLITETGQDHLLKISKCFLSRNE